MLINVGCLYSWSGNNCYGSIQLYGDVIATVYFGLEFHFLLIHCPMFVALLKPDGIILNTEQSRVALHHSKRLEVVYRP